MARESGPRGDAQRRRDRKSTRLHSSHLVISYDVFCLKKKTLTFAQKANLVLHRNTGCDDRLFHMQILAAVIYYDHYTLMQIIVYYALYAQAKGKPASE